MGHSEIRDYGSLEGGNHMGRKEGLTSLMSPPGSVACCQRTTRKILLVDPGGLPKTPPTLLHEAHGQANIPGNPMPFRLATQLHAEECADRSSSAEVTPLKQPVTDKVDKGQSTANQSQQRAAGWLRPVEEQLLAGKTYGDRCRPNVATLSDSVGPSQSFLTGLINSFR